MQRTLLSETIKLLRNRPRPMSLDKISEKIGVSVGWLTTLTSQHPPIGARVDAVERLYNLLADKPLFTDDDSNTPNC